eukprot:CAMPEP_0201593594 /NCGR_PEP_ID=MMETSP0190_2-20130828/191150_1 /ASSEMBLY_ACC=CAM_ASM_000263 /TAXON_ID=37353 /ORGANISM="Rosalina sp." /LENGTH=298 /DNA_ID=CAMNT_0048052843 /DNA_START=92 /DNA_END=987 /DNA_ORIENTATION=-
MTKMKRLYAKGGDIPCCRFDHISEYIPMINSILFMGGFDSQCNYNEAKLLSLSDMIWYDLEYQIDIDYRAYHTSTTRLIEDKTGSKWECYIFGGQYCSGGPYIYHNDVVKFTFYKKKYKAPEPDAEDTIFDIAGDDAKDAAEEQADAYFECEILGINGDDAPRERSQSYSWIMNNYLYIYGGSYATNTLNDLWRLDLNTNRWEEIDYDGILGAPKTKKLVPKPYRVVSRVRTCYYDEKLQQLFVIHFGGLSDIQREFIKFDDSLCEFEDRINDHETKDDEKDKDKDEDDNGESTFKTN